MRSNSVNGSKVSCDDENVLLNCSNKSKTVTILNTTELYILSGLTAWYVNYISIKS